MYLIMYFEIVSIRSADQHTTLHHNSELYDL